MQSLFGGSQNVTQKSAPWGPQQQYLLQGFGGAQNLYQNYTPQYYPGSTVEPFNPQEQQALTGIENTAQNDPNTQSSLNYANNLESGQYLNSNPGTGYFQNLVDPNNTQNKTLGAYASGQYLNNNPYQNQMDQSIAASVLPQVTAGFVNGNSMGNPRTAAYAASQGIASALALSIIRITSSSSQNQLGASRRRRIQTKSGSSRNG